MSGIKIRNVNEETSNANQLLHGEGQTVAMDPKKLKRVAASREYSQRYRLKQLQYIAQLETGVRALQAQMAVTYPRIKYANTQNSLLRAENSSMKKKLYDLSTELMMKEAEYHELKKEKDALKQLSVLYQSPIADTSEAKQQSFSQLVNIAKNQSGFNQFEGEARVPMMQDPDLENQFGSDVNNGENRNPM
ncbi:putative monovalent cation:proton antiporter [Hibiscus syriacus]|uniref:Monovalent cation:proton antiporter n=1 Tax=Hibiscus syriacus TaxID=106335 RepID=A0A6A3B5H7_HIBSY|nr:putative monovalent cation:proton antiporter [Hibiscus syriacus]